MVKGAINMETQSDVLYQEVKEFIQETKNLYINGKFVAAK